MEIVVVPEYAALSREGAARLAAVIRQAAPDAEGRVGPSDGRERAAGGHCVLGLATGGTPIGVYRELVRLHRQEGLDLSHVTTFNLDEYCGLPPDHPQSYHTYMRRHLFNHVDLDPHRARLPDGMAEDPAAECACYEAAIAQSGGMDILLLGVGTNGHIGFNEPGTRFDSRTHCVELAEKTRLANARFFPPGEAVPRRAITMGIATILAARQILLLATGAQKAEAIVRAALGPITPDCPASVLQRHPRVTLLLDQEAASQLPKRAASLPG